MCDLGINDMFKTAYAKLTPAESIPVMGVVGSIAKGLLALIQLVGGVALSLLTAPLSALCDTLCAPHNRLTELSATALDFSLLNTATAFGALVEAVLNIETLGLREFNAHES